MCSYKYEVAISYAGEDLPLVNLVCKLLEAEKISVFFAPANQPDIVGQPQTEKFHQIYEKESRFVAAFVSMHYVNKPVCMHEARSAMLRNLDGDYCLIPIYLDGTILPFFDPDIAYFKGNDPYFIKRLIVKRIRNNNVQTQGENAKTGSIVHIGNSIHIGEISGGKVKF